MDKPKPISLRMNAELKEMLDKLAKQFSIPEASVMRMALKQLHDRTFPVLQPGKTTVTVRHCKECGIALAPEAHTHCEYCSKLLGLLGPKKGPPPPKALRVLPSDPYLDGIMERIPTEEEVVDRIIKGG